MSLISRIAPFASFLTSNSCACASFTTGAAYAEFEEGRRGLIREGFDADMTVFARDILTVHVDELPKVAVQASVVGGHVGHAG